MKDMPCRLLRMNKWRTHQRHLLSIRVGRIGRELNVTDFTLESQSQPGRKKGDSEE